MAKPEKNQETTTQTTEPQAAEKRFAADVPKARLDSLVRQHVWGAMAVGLIPLPYVDLAAVTAVQLNLLRKLAKEYQVPFFKDKVKPILSALLGGAIPAGASGPLAASVIKTVPVLGQTVGVLAMPLLNGATTYAVGKVFAQHFASGGTFLTFNPEKVKAYYTEMFQEGQKVASTMKTEAA